MILIAGGTVLTPRGWAQADVMIDAGRVEAVGPHLRADTAAETVDASGCLVGPGFVDLHTHLREPGETWKEDIASGSRAGAAGGFTALVAMPNTDPPIDSPKIADLVRTRGAEVGLVDVIPSAALTMGRSGSEPVELDSLHESGVRMFSDDGDSVADEGVLLRLMEMSSRLPGSIIAQHAEDASVTGGGHMHDGAMSRQLGIGGLPASAETDVVQRDLELVARTGAHYHCQHVSSMMTVDMIRQAKSLGLNVTAEVAPHHLSFDDGSLADLDTNFKMYPPLRTKQDRLALVAALRDGTIDAVATDHAPHQPAEKAVPFEQAPRGVIGLETAAAAVWGALGEPDTMFRALAIAPAGIMDLADQGLALQKGATANVVVFDPDATWTPEEFASKSSNSPYLGRTMRGRVRATIHSGQITHRGGDR